MESANATKQIGKYEILSELGRGGMGVVYRAKHKLIGNEVAIKTLIDPTDDLRGRFLDEAKSLVLLEHENVVSVREYDEEDGIPYLVMDFIRGQSLERILKEQADFPLVKKLEILRRTSDGLGYVHSRGVVHRDIKPANIMLQDDGRTKIIDFGIARRDDTQGKTVTGGVIGTVHYISPERLKAEPFDGRSDIWSVGVILYQMLAGRLPFPGEGVEAMYKIANEPYPPVSQFASGYPAQLDAVIERALAKNPADRYAFAEDMASDLEEINLELKRSRVGEVLGQAERLIEDEQLSAARSLLLEMQRLDSQNTQVRRLLNTVRDGLAKQEKSKQINQLLSGADDAVRDRRYETALENLDMAVKLDPSSTGLARRLSEVRDLKKKFDGNEAALRDAREQRRVGNLDVAVQLIESAIAKDPANTDLLNEQARILQEQGRLKRSGDVRKLKAAARESMTARQFAEAVKLLDEALSLDPTDTETQQMHQDAVAREETERRRKIIDQMVSEIQEQVIRGQYERALDRVTRALERLPGEAVLLQLKAEAQRLYEESAAQKLVEETSVKVQAVFFTAPQEALATVQAALEKMPGEPRLVELEKRVIDELKRSNLAGLRSQYLKQAQAAVDAKNYTEAVRVLETAALECGESAEVQSLRDYAQNQRQASERHVASARAVRDAQELVGSGELELAIELLARAARETPDPAIDQLLRRTRETFDEVGRRVEEIVKRIRELADRDPASALALLEGQSQTIQLHPEMKALGMRLKTRGEQQRSTTEAVAKAGEQLRQGKLREGLLTLETVRQAYGDGPKIVEAISDYKAKRTRVATAATAQAVNDARHVFLAGEPKRALEILNNAAKSQCVDFAEPAAKEEFKTFAAKVGEAPELEAGDSTGLIVIKRKVNTKLIVAAAAAVVLAVIIAVVVLHKPQQNTPVPVATWTLKLNASPWAEVASVTPKGGGVAVPLPGGDHTTPVVLDGVPEGTYAVVFRLQDGGTLVAKECVVDKSNAVCEAQAPELRDDEIDAIMKGGAR